MSKVFLKISVLTLSLLMICSTMSFAVEKHFCGEFLVDVSFTGQAEGCGMKSDDTVSQIMKNCCKDEMHHIEGQDELQQHSVDDFNLEKQQFLTAFVISYKDLFIENESQKSSYKDFSPPDIPKDFQVAYQTFLI